MARLFGPERGPGRRVSGLRFVLPVTADANAMRAMLGPDDGDRLAA